MKLHKDGRTVDIQPKYVGRYRADGWSVDTPTQSDTKSTWVDHAVSRGLDRETAEAMTKSELVTQFG